MLTPKYPRPDTAPIPTNTPTTTYSPSAYHPTAYAPAPVSAAPASNRPTVPLTLGSVLTLAAGGGALVPVVGAVLVSMLLAVAITTASVAVCAVVIRSILKSDRRRPRLRSIPACPCRLAA
ncbi:SpdD protein [Streptomyces sp. NPDC005859]|uniref:SpdD protein n=1 Tax=Streptomyces sp. NPDC005859 TaxID=3157170 RepID=UPI0033FA39FE